MATKKSCNHSQDAFCYSSCYLPTCNSDSSTTTAVSNPESSPATINSSESRISNITIEPRNSVIKQRPKLWTSDSELQLETRSGIFPPHGTGIVKSRLKHNIELQLESHPGVFNPLLDTGGQSHTTTTPPNSKPLRQRRRRRRFLKNRHDPKLMPTTSSTRLTEGKSSKDTDKEKPRKRQRGRPLMPSTPEVTVLPRKTREMLWANAPVPKNSSLHNNGQILGIYPKGRVLEFLGTYRMKDHGIDRDVAWRGTPAKADPVHMGVLARGKRFSPLGTSDAEQYLAEKRMGLLTKAGEQVKRVDMEEGGGEEEEEDDDGVEIEDEVIGNGGWRWR